MTRIAVLGAGLAGSCTALELAEAGHQVDLYDRCDAPLTRASLSNEGKIHLGYVYALDASLETARTMVAGAAVFRPLLERWLSASFFEASVSEPFIYAVPHDSMLTPDELARHYGRVGALLREATGVLRTSRDIGADGETWRRLSEADCDALFDRDRIAAAFLTDEVAVDTPALCAGLRQALAAMPGLALHMGCEIEAASGDTGGYGVTGRDADGAFSRPYDAVVNTLWEQRLRIDETMGLRAGRPAIHRYKVGLRTEDPAVLARLPNVSFAIGEYGDAVVAGSSAYVSWYPAGLLAQETAAWPTRFDIPLDDARRDAVIAESLAGLRALMPGAAAVLEERAAHWRVVGGYISAWGKSGIDDRESELHQRYAVGVHSHGAYHSIDTGKLTLAPLFAAQACERIRAQFPIPQKSRATS